MGEINTDGMYFPDLSKTKGPYEIKFIYGSYSCSTTVYLPDPAKVEFYYSNATLGKEYILKS